MLLAPPAAPPPDTGPAHIAKLVSTFILYLLKFFLNSSGARNTEFRNPGRTDAHGFPFQLSKNLSPGTTLAAG
jgi:hypothetical protein